ncbi:MAG: 30S ribosome-binding factor RbfA [Chloroflexi bacterium]|nr:30S ribosome-binding factor RbfA [Chloroflexota bacterium]
MVSKTRMQRVAERIREELSEMLVQEIADPRLAGISVTDVTVDRELAYAKIYISAIEGYERWKEIQEGLKSAQGFIRRELAQRIELRTFPQLRFIWDPTFERAEKVERLFAQLEAERRARGESAGEEHAEDAGKGAPEDNE